MVSAVGRIKKRDGTVADFNQDKITNAISKAMKSEGISDPSVAKTASDIVCFMIEEKFGGYTIPSVEQIQDVVEKVLIENGHARVAKAYILYRDERTRTRLQGSSTSDRKENIPWGMTPSYPASRPNAGSMWMGLKSPEAAA